MENEHVVPSYESPSKRGHFKGKNILYVISGIVLVSAISTASYFLGQRSKDGETLSPTPTAEILPTETPTPAPEESKTNVTLTPTNKLTGTLTPSPTPVLKTKILSSSAILDGFRSSNGGGNSTVEIRAGRNVNLVTRGFISFDLSELPAGLTIDKAHLRLHQSKIIGNPYAVGASIKVDHLTYGDSLDSADYGMAALSSSFTTLTTNATVEWKDADVTDRVKDDIANARSRSQFRIHFQIENTGGDVTGDFVYFEAADNNMGTGNTPQLVVKFY